MSRDPNSWYEEEYWEEIGRQEDIAKAIKNLSQQPIRDFLGTYGDAIIAQPRYARRSGYPLCRRGRGDRDRTDHALHAC
jgi:hypothetical protein